MGQNIGALWTNHKGDLEYYAGNIKLPFDVKAGDRIKIVVFTNEKKEQENHPDYNILLSTPKKQG